MAAEADLKDLRNQLYYSSVPVHFSVVDGQAIPFVTDLLHDSTSKSAKQKAIARSQFGSQSSLGQGYETLILPSMPAADVEIESDVERRQLTANSTLPLELSQPLLKTQSGCFAGFQSGMRSALVHINGRWYRLKGCGNLDQGFPLRAVPSKGGVEIRGCCFEHTCHREQLMTAMIGSLLSQEGILSANTPVGWWEYNIADENIAALRKIKKYCGIFETLGDRRLADHLLVGIELLLPLFASYLDEDALLARFPQSRFPDSPRTLLSTAMVALITETVDAFVDSYAFPLQESIPSEMPANVEAKWTQLWQQCIQTLKTALPFAAPTGNAPGSLLAYLYWRIGRETGAIQRILTAANISWGTYQDDLGFHCNSHPNNFVVLSQEHSQRCEGRLLAPLDFDMAFSKISFTLEPAIFDEWLILERQGLKASLAGDELNTGVAGSAEFTDQRLLNLRTALRDTMLVAFMESFQGIEDRHPSVPELEPAVHALIQLALIMTAQRVA